MTADAELIRKMTEAIARLDLAKGYPCVYKLKDPNVRVKGILTLVRDKES